MLRHLLAVRTGAVGDGDDAEWSGVSRSGAAPTVSGFDSVVSVSRGTVGGCGVESGVSPVHGDRGGDAARHGTAGGVVLKHLCDVVEGEHRPVGLGDSRLHAGLTGDNDTRAQGFRKGPSPGPFFDARWTASVRHHGK